MRTRHPSASLGLSGNSPSVAVMPQARVPLPVPCDTLSMSPPLARIPTVNPAAFRGMPDRSLSPSRSLPRPPHPRAMPHLRPITRHLPRPCGLPARCNRAAFELPPRGHAPYAFPAAYCGMPDRSLSSTPMRKPESCGILWHARRLALPGSHPHRETCGILRHARPLAPPHAPARPTPLPPLCRSGEGLREGIPPSISACVILHCRRDA
jgi:hypothetical protein